ncbi:MAG TPA: DUF4249 domain-containing protein [Bacteroidales bacterium]|nr:DUF4249 domain-containing protein [Bacteroidales bacterium]
MKEKIEHIIPLILLLLFTGCSDEFEDGISDPDDMIVVDGWIENNQFAKVLLTKNTPYFSSLDSASIRQLVLTRAKVTLSDGENSEVLILRKIPEYFPPFVFEGNEIKGMPGKSYTITAEYGGKTVISTTTIPEIVSADIVNFNLKEGSDSLGTITIEFNDPPEESNYYRVLSKVRGKDSRFSSSLMMGISDSYFNGQRFGYTMQRGQNNYLTQDKNSWFRVGDTVDIKFCTIDKEHFEFWKSYQDEVFNSGNPFASSLSGLKSNIIGGLGVWGGYGVYFTTLIIR